MPSLWSLSAVFAEVLCAKLQHSTRNLPATFRLPYTHSAFVLVSSQLF